MQKTCINKTTTKCLHQVFETNISIVGALFMQYLARSCNLLKQILFYVLYSSEENSLNDYFSDNLIIKKNIENDLLFHLWVHSGR